MKSLQSFSEAVSKEVDEKELNIDKLVSAENETLATQVFESAATIVALEGKSLSSSKLDTAMSHPEFSKDAKTWITSFLKQHPNGLDALLNWLVLVGKPILEVKPGKFKQFIHQNINAYYSAAPSAFQVAAAGKANTADTVFIQKGDPSSLMATLKEISGLPDASQLSRLVIDNETGKVTLLNERGRQAVIFYQVSLKKAAGGGARIGRATTFFNKNYVGGGIARPSTADVAKQEYQEELEEGWIRDALDKFKSIVSLGIGPFISWIKKRFPRIATKLGSRANKIATRFTKRDKGFKAINNILVMGGLKEENLTEGYLTEGYLTELADVKLTSGMIEDFKFIKDDILDKNKLNKLHDTNIRLMQKLNSNYAVTDRSQVPIKFAPTQRAGLIETRVVKKQIGNVLRQKEGSLVSRTDLQAVFKIGMNYSANVAIWAMLKSVESGISKYNNLSEALYAFSATIEAEVKFGNTALPLVIVYGGEKGEKKVLGTRIDYQKVQLKSLNKWGKKADDFPVLVIKINKSGGIEPYNVVKFYLVSSFVAEKPLPKPIWMVFEVQTQSGSSFSTKIEGSAMTRNWAGR